MDKRFLAILGAIIAIFIGIFVITQGSEDKDNPGSGGSGQPTSHVKGEGTEGVTLMEYGDFQCPVCAAYEPTLRQVYEKYSEDIKFQFRHLPLTIHQNAFAASRAAEAAGLQGKFWEMHDKLYENQAAWSNSNSALTVFKNYAGDIGLDAEKFAADYASSRVNSAINADISAFNKTGQSMATPTFFINGKYISNADLRGPDGAPTLERFSAVIDAEIKKQQ